MEDMTFGYCPPELGTLIPPLKLVALGKAAPSLTCCKDPPLKVYQKPPAPIFLQGEGGTKISMSNCSQICNSAP